MADTDEIAANTAILTRLRALQWGLMGADESELEFDDAPAPKDSLVMTDAAPNDSLVMTNAAPNDSLAQVTRPPALWRRCSVAVSAATAAAMAAEDEEVDETCPNCNHAACKRKTMDTDGEEPTKKNKMQNANDFEEIVIPDTP